MAYLIKPLHDQLMRSFREKIISTRPQRRTADVEIVDTTKAIATPNRVGAHPGEVLNEEFLKPLGLSINAQAIALRVPATRIGSRLWCTPLTLPVLAVP